MSKNRKMTYRELIQYCEEAKKRMKELEQQGKHVPLTTAIAIDGIYTKVKKALDIGRVKPDSEILNEIQKVVDSITILKRD